VGMGVGGGRGYYSGAVCHIFCEIWENSVQIGGTFSEIRVILRICRMAQSYYRQTDRHNFYHFNILCILILIEVHFVTKYDSTLLYYPNLGIETLY